MNDSRKEKMPWWKSGLIVGLLGSAIPLASFIQGWWHKDRELELQRQRQFSDLRIAYANLMLEGGVERVELLADFVAQTESDPEIKAWATRQSQVAETHRKRLQQELEIQQKKVVEAEQRVAEANTLAEAAKKQAEAAAANANAQREAREKEIAAKNAVIDAEAKASVAYSNAAVSRETLKGRAIQMVAPPVPQTIMNSAVQRGLNVKSGK
jgi:hypothetical protein